MPKTSKQVCRNATFSLGSDGNLVLAEADSTVVCQSNTANKGVVGFKLLPNGNMVLHDSKGNFIWQSFDYPTDALLVGQSLLSVKENVSFVMEPKRFTLYYKGSNSPQPVLYHDSPLNGEHDPSVQNLTFNSRPETDEAFAYELTLDISDSGSDILDRPKYNIRSSFLRLGMHGNLKIYTHYDKVDSQPTQLPERCSKLGVCDDNQCVACPTEKGLLRWSKECEARNKYTSGTAIKVEDCGSKCTSDCKCSGYFYHQETSKCWIAYDLKTLSKSPNSQMLDI
ncbi:EP1-like glycoprotein 3 [Citrus sinensis]|uniref:EP1-like glycoprotein 3 n=1 Tax=Citrus sinensis TaxID=2711 RepID=A0ACB8M019_CITSI|nr:EP1-like glycoprotein 3 [Citrus sinensis]